VREVSVWSLLYCSTQQQLLLVGWLAGWPAWFSPFPSLGLAALESTTAQHATTTTTTHHLVLPGEAGGKVIAKLVSWLSEHGPSPSMDQPTPVELRLPQKNKTTHGL